MGLALSACGTDPILLGELIAAAERGEADAPVEEDPPTSEPDEPDPYEPDPPPVPDDETLVEEVLLFYCGDCHHGPSVSTAAGLGVIGDIDALVARGMIVPGSKEDSRVYVRMLDDTMPPVTIESPRPTEAEIDYVGRFVDDMD
jgi:hypothetical protein